MKVFINEYGAFMVACIALGMMFGVYVWLPSTVRDLSSTYIALITGVGIEGGEYTAEGRYEAPGG